MAGEFQGQSFLFSGTAYARLRRKTDAQIWSTAGTPAFEAYNGANIADYAVGAAAPDSSGYCVADAPTITGSAAGWYTYNFYQRVGGSPAVTDPCISGTFELYWDGSAWAPSTVDVNVVQISGDATAADNLETAFDGGSYNVGGGAVVAASVTGAVGSVTGNVGGSVGSIATGGIAAASFAANAIDAAALAADAVTEIATGVWASATRTLTSVAGLTISAQLANGVTHGGSTALLRLGGGDATTPSFYVTNANASGAAARFLSGDATLVGAYTKVDFASGGGYGVNVTAFNGGTVQADYALCVVSGVQAISVFEQATSDAYQATTYRCTATDGIAAWCLQMDSNSDGAEGHLKLAGPDTSVDASGDTILSDVYTGAMQIDGGAAAALTLTSGAGTAALRLNGGGDGILITNDPSYLAIRATGGSSLGPVAATTLTTTGTVTFNALTVTNATTLTGVVTATHAGNDIRGVQVTSGTVTTVTGNVEGSVQGDVEGDLWGKALGNGVSAFVAAGVRIDLTPVVPTTNVDNSIGDCLNAARAQGFGKWAITGGTTLTLYAPDGTTPVRTFTLDAAEPNTLSRT